MSTITRRAASPCIARHRIRERDASRRDFQVELLDGETFADVLNPSFLGAKSEVYGAGDRIAIVGHELSFWGEVIVVETDEALAAVKVVPLIGPIDLTSRIAEAIPFDVSRIAIESLAPDNWRLRQGNAVIASGFKSEKQANARLAEIKQGRKASRAGE